MALCAILSASCEKKAETSFSNEEVNGMTAVELKINDMSTKALTDNGAETRFNSIQVFLYSIDSDGNQKYDSYYNFDSGKTDNTSHTIYIDLNKDDITSYRTVVYANHPAITPGSTLHDWSLFANEKVDNFQMVGQSTNTIDELASSKKISVSAIRQCSKITVKEIALDWKNSANSLKSFKLKGMYLMDVPGVFKNNYDINTSIAEDNSLWHNKKGHTSNSHDALLYDEIDNADVTENTPYTTKHIFYGYISALNEYYTTEEWKPSGTRLIIEAEFDGKTCYYAVRVNGADGSEPMSDIRNKHFIFDRITITKPGSDQPYSALPEETGITVSVSIAPWENIENDNFIIQ